MSSNASKHVTVFSPDSATFKRIRVLNGHDLELLPDSQWVCLHVKPGTEFKIAARLIDKGVSFFIPLSLRPGSNTLRPLWTNYVFCRVDLFQRSYVRRVREVNQLLEPPDEEELILHLRHISPVSKIVPFEKYDKVKVKTGALQGFVARIEDVDDEKLIVRMSLNLLGKTVQVLRSYDEVEIVEHSGPSITVRPVNMPAEIVMPEPVVPAAANRDALNVQIEAISSEFIKYLSRHPDLLYKLEPRRFEVLVAELLSDMGYEVELTPETRDGGRDILAAFDLPHGKILTLVECKRFRPERKVGIDILERFLWVMDRKDKASCGLIATTSYFSPEAIATERDYQWRLRLRDFEGLKEWLSKYGSWTRSSRMGLWLPD